MQAGSLLPDRRYRHNGIPAFHLPGNSAACSDPYEGICTYCRDFSIAIAADGPPIP